jgi:hypothetical protein
VPPDAFVAMDYPMDWIFASAYMSKEGVNLSGKHMNTDGRVSGNQEDVDLIVTFDSARQLTSSCVSPRRRLAGLISSWIPKPSV